MGAGFDRAPDAIDHVALRIDDYAAFRRKLDESGVPYSTMELPELAERRLFLHAPNGPLIEAVYREAASGVGDGDTSRTRAGRDALEVAA